MSDGQARSRNPWAWVPTLYFAEGLPNALVAGVSIVLYKALGISNTLIAFYTGFFYLPWVLKPLWSPVVEMLQTRRAWIWKMQFFMAMMLAALAMVLPTKHFFPLSILFFWLLAFGSATHDIAADGFYMVALSEGQQSFFVGIRNTLYRAANLFAKGPFIIFAAILQERIGMPATAWSLAFGAASLMYAAFAAYHWFVAPRPEADTIVRMDRSQFWKEFGLVFAAFFRKKGIGLSLAFLLLYRFAEAQLLPIMQPFLLDPRADGGLGLTEKEVGMVYGTAGVIALMLGGITGGVVVSRNGLRAWLWPMLLILHVPNAVFVYMSYALPQNLAMIGACVCVEQFGYGFGFTAYMLYMIYIARGEHSTAHYAICTGFMALGLMLPGMWSGWLQEQLGYRLFFVWVLVAAVPSIAVTAMVSIDAAFGRKQTKPA